MTEIVAIGQFDITMTPSDGLLPGTGRFDFIKTWTGETDGNSSGVMLSAGDPTSGDAGYVCLEVFEGSIAGRRGSIAFQQFGAMTGSRPDLRYEVVPGSGTGHPTGLIGTVGLEVIDGVHHVEIRLQPASA